MTNVLVDLTDGKIPPNLMVSYDSEEIIELLAANDIKYLKIEHEGTRMKFFYLIKDVDPLKNLLLSSAPIMVDYQKVLVARSAWKRGLVMAKSVTSGAK